MKQLIDGWKDILEKNRFRILYVVALASLLIAVTGWSILPDEVSMTLEAPAVAKNTALLANLGLVGVFSAAFVWKPREILYFVAMALALLVGTIPLLMLVAAL